MNISTNEFNLVSTEGCNIDPCTGLPYPPELGPEDWKNCQNLVVAIIEQAVNDHRFVQRMARAKRLCKYNRKKLDKIEKDEFSPAEFFES